MREVPLAWCLLLYGVRAFCIGEALRPVPPTLNDDDDDDDDDDERKSVFHTPTGSTDLAGHLWTSMRASL